MAAQRIVLFFVRSIIIGGIVALLILLLVPELRHGSGLDIRHLFNQTSPPKRLSYHEAISRSAPAVVNIYSVSIEANSFLSNTSRERTNLGSGVIMTEDGFILTCHHVIDGAASIYVALQDSRLFEAQIIGHDLFTDLAVLKINADNLIAIPQYQDPQVKVGDITMAIGNPYNLGQTITHGIISRTGRNGLANYVDFIQTDAVLNQGNSGGALVDSEGYLLGITNANFRTVDAQRRVRNVDGINFAVPYPLALRVMNELIVNGKVTRGQLGFSGNEFAGQDGIVISNITPGSPADLAGLQVGDRLIAIDGVPLTSASAALDMIAETPPGTLMELQVVRSESTLTILVTVGELQLDNVR
jgi:serine protease DegS